MMVIIVHVVGEAQALNCFTAKLRSVSLGYCHIQYYTSFRIGKRVNESYILTLVYAMAKWAHRIYKSS